MWGRCFRSSSTRSPCFSCPIRLSGFILNIASVLVLFVANRCLSWGVSIILRASRFDSALSFELELCFVYMPCFVYLSSACSVCFVVALWLCFRFRRLYDCCCSCFFRLLYVGKLIGRKIGLPLRLWLGLLFIISVRYIIKSQTPPLPLATPRSAPRLIRIIAY